MRRLCLLFLLLRLGGAWDVCGISGCVCDPRADSASCGGLFFETLPKLPPWLRHFQLRSGHLTALKAASFSGSAILDSICILDSGLNFLHPKAFEGLANLASLDLSGNNIEALPPLLLKGSRRLASLSLAGNSLPRLGGILAAIPHRANFLMDSLDLSGVGLRIAWHGDHLPHVKALNLSRNRIAFANETGLLFPQSRNCSRGESCRFLRLPLAKLEFLDVSECGMGFGAAFLGTLTKLRHLSIGGNDLSSADALNSLYEFESLEALNVSHLAVAGAFGAVPTWDIFPKTLRSLDVSGMGIVHVDTDFAPAANSMQELYARDNRILEFQLQPQYTRLAVLDLAGNQLSDFPKLVGFSELKSLTKLDLSRNHIEILRNGSLRAFPNLRVLLLSHNGLHSVAASALPSLGLANLRTLDLSQNELQRLPALLLPVLDSLDLSHNVLRTLAADFFLGLPDLKTLKLSGNARLLTMSTHCDAKATAPPIDCFPPFLRHLPSLVFLSHLDASGTGVSALPSRLLASFRMLNVLLLDDNRITSVVLDAWVGGAELPACLIRFGLGGNRLTTLANASFATTPGSCLEVLDLSRNPWKCGCHLATLRPLLFPGPAAPLLIRDSHDAARYACSWSDGRAEALWDFLAGVRPCGEKSPLLGLGVASVFCLSAAVVLGLCWRLGSVCGRRVSSNMHYLYRPLASIPSQLSSPVHL